ncbi:hypothetical protein EYF80_039006 [Liparis tanakae]|uniref:Uncharacterized protein n=1 Tax=Liparis tanakae TaxID=230148 RepID=A0A4Z2GDJ4_9TELE|nr:hypothetical protein EYF80_039006 [Liparis tanakae]
MLVVDHRVRVTGHGVFTTPSCTSGREESLCTTTTTTTDPQSPRLAEPGVFGLGAFLEMVGILEGLAPGRRGVSEASEPTERASWSSDASEASLPRRLPALLPARLPARLVGPLAVDPPRFGSGEQLQRYACGVAPFSPVSEPRLEWNVGLFSLDPDGAPCRRTVTRNSSSAIQPPPTRTITVLRRILTRRSCWESPN